MACPTFLQVGDGAEFSRTVTEADLLLFAELSGDFDPVHVDEEYARTTPFGRRIAHGALVMGLLSTTASVISRRSVARGSPGVPVSLGYDRIRFLHPAFIGDTLTARYTIEAVDDAAARTRARVEVVNGDGTLCLAGTHILRWVTPAA